MAITFTNPISGLDLLRTPDNEISEMGRFVYENQKDRGYESSVEKHVKTIERYARQRTGAVLFKAYDGDTLVGFRFIAPIFTNHRWVNPNDGDEVGKKFRDWLVSEKVDLNAMWSDYQGVNPSYYRQGLTKEFSTRASVEAKRLGLIYKICFGNPDGNWAASSNSYLSDNPVVYSDIDFDTYINGDNGKLGYVKL